MSKMFELRMKKKGTETKQANGFVTDRDEKGEPKVPEKLEVPRLASEEKPDTKIAAPAPAADVPAPIPAAPSKPTNPANADILALPSETIAKIIKAIGADPELTNDRNVAGVLATFSEELAKRPVEPEEPAAPAPVAAPAAVPQVASKKEASSGGAWSGQDQDEGEIVENGGRTPEIAQAHGMRDDKTGIKKPTTTLPIKLAGNEVEKTAGDSSSYKASPEKFIEKLNSFYNAASELSETWNQLGDIPEYPFQESFDELLHKLAYYVDAVMDGYKRDGSSGVEVVTSSLKTAAELTTKSAVKLAERMGTDLKRLYLEAKPLTNVNDQRPVREAVEGIFRAADGFDGATKLLVKQLTQEEGEAKAQEESTKKKAVASLNIAAEDTSEIRERLEYLRGELRAEGISYEELAELQSLVDYIDPSDVELLEVAGVPEFGSDDNLATMPNEIRDDGMAGRGNTPEVFMSPEEKGLGNQVVSPKRSSDEVELRGLSVAAAEDEKTLIPDKPCNKSWYTHGGRDEKVCNEPAEVQCWNPECPNARCNDHYQEGSMGWTEPLSTDGMVDIALCEDCENYDPQVLAAYEKLMREKHPHLYSKEPPQD
jgi:hypothetical protein